MIGIKYITSYIPENRIDNTNFLEQFDTTEDFLLNKTGMLRLAKKEDDEDTSDLCCKAVHKLTNETGISLNDIECLIVCTQNPDNLGLPHTSAIVHGKLNLSTDCAVFDISLGCSGYVYGLSIIKGFMLTNNIKNGILITSDPYSKIIDKKDKNTALLFGDAATATWLGETPEWNIGRFCFGSDGKHHSAIQINPETKLLEMNGRAVFNFTAKIIPENIKRAIKINELKIDDIEKFILHQGSKYIRDTLIKKLKIEEKKTPFQAREYGNTISSSIPIILSEYIHSPHKHILISGFGVGLSWASTVLTKHSN